MDMRAEPKTCKVRMKLMFSCFGVSLKREVKGVAAGEDEKRDKGKKTGKKREKGKRSRVTLPYIHVGRSTGASRTVPVDQTPALDVAVDLEETVEQSGTGRYEIEKEEESPGAGWSPPWMPRRREEGQTDHSNQTSGLTRLTTTRFVEDRNHIHNTVVESPKNDRWQRRRLVDRCIQTGGGSSTTPEAKLTQETQPFNQNLIGLWVVIVTGLIVVLWGKICGVVFTCAWLCIVSHLRQFQFRRRNIINEPPPCEAVDYSKEDKDKVVLEGLLARSRRRPR